ncbi:MAG TPA: amino acid--tRNA ligase-related protein [archaeon]|nr:amino acid--tRNA ligase-related protein [archaeon]
MVVKTWKTLKPDVAYDSLSFTAILDDRGRILIPASIRKKLKIKFGSLVLTTVEPKHKIQHAYDGGDFSIDKYGDLSSLDLVRKRHLSIKHPKLVKILKIQDEILAALRDFLRQEGFIEILAPIIGPVSDPGIRGAKIASIDYYGVPFKVMSSMILYKQLAMSSLGKIFALSPCIRMEPLETTETGRHLTEFRQLDLEIAEVGYEDAMIVAERLIQYVCKKVACACDKELEQLGRKLKIPKIPFKKIKYDEAIELLKQKGFYVEYGEEIPWEEEKIISEMFDEPFFIYDYPLSSRGFYDREDPKRPGILRDFDLIYPEGFGEAVSGGEREHTFEGVVKRMELTKEDSEKYEWYLEMLKAGIPPSAGFGVGVERLTRFICGLDKIWEALPFPKVAGVISP